MLNFGLKHCHSSGWHKKFPRHKIEREDPKHLGMHQHLRLRNEWFEGRQGFLSRKEINKFLEANLGKNVDEVFSEFVKRAKRYKHDDNLREVFYRQLNPNYRWRGDYSLDSQNRIIKKKEEKTDKISTIEAKTFNENNYPSDIKPYLKEVGLTYIGDFYLRTKYWSWIKVPVYICSKEWYNLVLTYGIGNKYVKMSNMARVLIHFNKDTAAGIHRTGYTTKQVPTGRSHEVFGHLFEIYDDVRIPYSTTDYKSDYIFLTKRDTDINLSEY